MVYSELVNKAMNLAFIAHMKQSDIGGYPYIHHLMHVAEQMDTENEVCVALLHDIIEDSSDVSIEDLIKMGFPDDVVTAIKLMTHTDGVSYEDYIKALSINELARKVKIADLRHNLDKTRLPKGMKFRKYETYEKALEYLYNVI